MVVKYNKSDSGQLSKNFRLAEFKCKCSRCDTTLVDTELVSILQKIRDHFDAPVNINSAYRCPEHNAEVPNSSKNSRHMKGMAADICVKGVDPLEVAKYAESIGVPGIGYYEEQGFTHVDTRENSCYWLGHAGKVVSTFGGAPVQTCTVTLPVLKRGCKSETVMALQLLLQGYTNARLAADGSFGPATELEVKEFQEKNGLDKDGYVGPATWAKLLGV